MKNLSSLSTSHLLRRLLQAALLLALFSALFAVVKVPSALGNPVILATKLDVLTVDVDADNFAGPGDTLRYTTWVTNTGSTDAGAVVCADTIDTNTTLVAGMLRTTPIARNDSYASLGNVGIAVPLALAQTAPLPTCRLQALKARTVSSTPYRTTKATRIGPRSS